MQPTRLQIVIWMLPVSRRSESSRHPLAVNSCVTSYAEAIGYFRLADRAEFLTGDNLILPTHERRPHAEVEALNRLIATTAATTSTYRPIGET
jgi:hypothetical protein